MNSRCTLLGTANKWPPIVSLAYHGDANASGCCWSRRWFTSQFVHTDFRHILSNMLLFLVLAGLMEVKYGSVRVAAVWSMAYMGGQLLSVALENPCIQVGVMDHLLLGD